VPLVSPLANLIAVPLAEPLTVVGFVVATAAGLVGNHAARLVGFGFVPLAGMLGWVRLVAHAGAAVPVQLHLRGALAAVATVAAVRAARSALGGSLRGDAPARFRAPNGALPDDPRR
jgi:hypothetical protein